MKWFCRQPGADLSKEKFKILEKNLREFFHKAGLISKREPCVMLQKVFGEEILGVIDSQSWTKGLVFFFFWHFLLTEMQKEGLF